MTISTARWYAYIIRTIWECCPYVNTMNPLGKPVVSAFLRFEPMHPLPILCSRRRKTSDFTPSRALKMHPLIIPVKSEASGIFVVRNQPEVALRF